MAARTTKSVKSAKPKLAAVAKSDDVQRDLAAQDVVKPAQLADLPDAELSEIEIDDADAAPDAKGDAVKMKELMSAVVTKTGAKKKDAKDVVDAVLAEMAAALSAGKSLNLPPLGNLRVAKMQDKGGAKMLVLKLRMGGGNGTKDALAQDGEDS